MRRSTPVLGLLTLLCALLAACETSPPELYELQWLLVDFDDRELDRRYESLSLFVRAGDADGLDDLDEIYLIFDTGELFWRLTASTWTRTDRAGEPWIGTTSLTMPGQQPFPAGEYRLLLLDLGGQRDAMRFVIPAQRSSTPAPEVTARGARFEVRGAADYALWVVADGVLLTTLAAAEAIDLERHLEPRAGTRYQIYVFGRDPDADKGTLVGPFRWQPP